MRAFTRLDTIKRHLTSAPRLSTSFFQINEKVRQAIIENKPVVALESTIITHGMEYPTNMTTALAVEQNIIDQGAIPATIGIIDGIIHVGITNEQIEYLAKNKSS
jgi:pseudouridylate synthase